MDTKADMAPTRKPDSLPRATPDIITIARMGLKLGIMKNAALPTTAVAMRTASRTSSLAWGFLPSNFTKKGTIARIPINMLINK